MESKNTIEVCLSPALLHTYNLENKIVVIIDVLRATSTICAALEHGVQSIIPVSSINDCMEYAGKENYLLAAEREAQLPEGFIYGNSPHHYINKTGLKNKKLVLTTTNGTKMLLMAKAAETIAIGAFVNIDALCAWIVKQNKNVLMACSAWKDKVNMEDSVFAGGVAYKLSNTHEAICDSGKMMKQIYSIAKNDILQYHMDAHHWSRLTKLGAEKDLIYCFTENASAVVPVLNNNELILV